LQYAAEVQSLKEHAGWSADSRLPLAQQLWLDPLRGDPPFQHLREAKDWHQDIADQFANWLNHKLKDDKLMLKDVEYLEWSKLVERKLALLKDDLEVLAS
jgi:CRISPR-associated protein Csy1